MERALRNLNNLLHTPPKKFRLDVVSALRQLHLLVLLLKHQETPWRAKVAAAFAALYVLSPIQLIPTFIPIIGQMDDLFVLWLAMKLARKFCSDEIVADCEAQAKLTPAPRSNLSAAPCGQERPPSFVQSE
jgi:uncharacterized membrane protein YkvA (DUF1232 family)